MNSSGFHHILDSNPDNFVEVYASFLGINALQVGISVNNQTVSVQTHILDARGQFNLANMVNIDRSNLTSNMRQIDIIYNRAVVYTYSYIQPPNDPSSSDSEEESESLLDPNDPSSSDSEEEPAAEEPAAAAAEEEPAAAAASSSDAGASASPRPSTSSADTAAAPEPTDAVEFLPGMDTPFSPLGWDDSSSLDGSLDGMAGSDDAVDGLDGSSSTDFSMNEVDREE